METFVFDLKFFCLQLKNISIDSQLKNLKIAYTFDFEFLGLGSEFVRIKKETRLKIASKYKFFNILRWPR